MKYKSIYWFLFDRNIGLKYFRGRNPHEQKLSRISRILNNREIFQGHRFAEVYEGKKKIKNNFNSFFLYQTTNLVTDFKKILTRIVGLFQ